MKMHVLLLATDIYCEYLGNKICAKGMGKDDIFLFREITLGVAPSPRETRLRSLQAISKQILRHENSFLY